MGRRRGDRDLTEAERQAIRRLVASGAAIEEVAARARVSVRSQRTVGRVVSDVG